MSLPQPCRRRREGFNHRVRNCCPECVAKLRQVRRSASGSGAPICVKAVCAATAARVPTCLRWPWQSKPAHTDYNWISCVTGRGGFRWKPGNVDTGTWQCWHLTPTRAADPWTSLWRDLGHISAPAGTLWVTLDMTNCFIEVCKPPVTGYPAKPGPVLRPFMVRVLPVTICHAIVVQSRWPSWGRSLSWGSFRPLATLWVVIVFRDLAILCVCVFFFATQIVRNLPLTTYAGLLKQRILVEAGHLYRSVTFYRDTKPLFY